MTFLEKYRATLLFFMLHYMCRFIHRDLTIIDENLNWTILVQDFICEAVDVAQLVQIQFQTLKIHVFVQNFVFFQRFKISVAFGRISATDYDFVAQRKQFFHSFEADSPIPSGDDDDSAFSYE